MRTLAVLALLLGTSPQERRPNVVVILTDDQGFGDRGVHGNDAVRTPAGPGALGAEVVDRRGATYGVDFLELRRLP